MSRVVLALVLLVAAGCQGSSDELTVYAAASLTDAFEELAAAYEEETGVAITLSFDSSSALRTQIEEGAPADVFASADFANAVALVDAGRTEGDLSVFAQNALALVVPEDGTAVDDWTDLASDGIRVVAAGEDVPITAYAQDVVENLASEDGAPEGFADVYQANVASREDNVRAVLAKIEVGEGDAAFVYETDATSSDGVRSVEIPEGANVSAEYAAVTITDASPGAADFTRWLLSEAAQEILASHGFRPPG